MQTEYNSHVERNVWSTIAHFNSELAFFLDLPCVSKCVDERDWWLVMCVGQCVLVLVSSHRRKGQQEAPDGSFFFSVLCCCCHSCACGYFRVVQGILRRRLRGSSRVCMRDALYFLSLLAADIMLSLVFCNRFDHVWVSAELGPR